MSISFQDAIADIRYLPTERGYLFDESLRFIRWADGLRERFWWIGEYDYGPGCVSLHNHPAWSGHRRKGWGLSVGDIGSAARERFSATAVVNLDHLYVAYPPWPDPFELQAVAQELFSGSPKSGAMMLHYDVLCRIGVHVEVYPL